MRTMKVILAFNSIENDNTKDEQKAEYIAAEQTILK